MKFLQKSLQFLVHSCINALHSRTVDQRKCNSVDRSKECNLDTLYQSRHRCSHCLITGWLKTLQTPYQTDKGSKNTQTGKNIRCHLQNLLMYMKIDLVFIYILFNAANTFLVLTHGINEVIHSVIQIFVIKDSLQAGEIFRLCLAGHFEYTGKLLCTTHKCLCDAIHPEHSSEESYQIDHCHNGKKYKVISHRAD